MKWKLVLKGVGKLYSAICDELEKNNHRSQLKALADASYRVGLDFGETLKADYQLEDTIEDLLFALQVDHKVFGIRAAVSEKSDRKVVYHCYECAWEKYFKPKLCIAIGQAEKGIIHALNPEAKYYVLQTRTMGKEHCVIAIEI